MHDNEAPSMAELTTRIVAAYCRVHHVAAADIGRLVSLVGAELNDLASPARQPAKIEPAVPVEESVQPDSLVCLECGGRFKSLRRHLQSAHGLTPSRYREKYALDRDYPMIAANASARRSEIARRSGLGRRMPNELDLVEPG